MSWNFCPWCGHRTYQHNDEGCLHAEIMLKECEDPECHPANIVVVDGTHAHDVPVQCDCKHPHPQLMER
jgi:hypothetical protein